jgi:hypothetical protein
MYATFVDIENEFSEIADEIDHQSHFLDRLTDADPVHREPGIMGGGSRLRIRDRKDLHRLRAHHVESGERR